MGKITGFLTELSSQDFVKRKLGISANAKTIIMTYSGIPFLKITDKTSELYPTGVQSLYKDMFESDKVAQTGITRVSTTADSTVERVTETGKQLKEKKTGKKVSKKKDSKQKGSKKKSVKQKTSKKSVKHKESALEKEIG